MLLPVRCFTCGKVIGNKGRAFDYLCQKHHAAESPALEAFRELRVRRYCCRRMFLANYDYLRAIGNAAPLVAPPQPKNYSGR